MRAFIVLCFLATSVYAQSLGYNYGVGHAGALGNGGLVYSSGTTLGNGNGYQLLNNNGGLGSLNLGQMVSYNSGGILGSSSSGLINNVGLSAGPLNHLNTGSLSGANFATDYSGASSLNYNHNNGLIGGHDSFVEAPVDIEVTKEFYTFEAPEQDYQEHEQNLNQVRSSIKKHQKVIFIKTPENRAYEKAAVSLARNAVETNSAIYVLHKQPDISSLATKLITVNTLKAAKPEVHFVKYNTAEDAANAQRTIQSHYETLGGSTVFKNGGIPRVLNFATNYAPAYMNPSYSIGHSGVSDIVSSGSLLGNGGIIGSGGIISHGGSLSGSGISSGSLNFAGSSNIGSISTGGDSLLETTNIDKALESKLVKVSTPTTQYLPTAVKK